MAATKDENSERSDAGGFRIATRTHVGLWRERNEDYLSVRETRHGLLIVVCDGMGGHVGGEHASRVAVGTLLDHVERGKGSAGEILRHATAEANNAILAESRKNPEYQRMGTTLVAALLREAKATIANVGDSRAYLFRGDSLQRVSRDHSLVGEMVQRGEITEEEAASHPQRNIITRALGGSSNAEPDTFDLNLERGDVILLASDGLHGMVSDNDIREVLLLIPDPARACDELVERALSAGGNDNISVIIARFAEGGEITEAPTTDPAHGERRGPRGLGLIAGVALGAIGLLVLLIVFWSVVLRPDIDNDISRRDSNAVRFDTVREVQVIDSGVMSGGTRYDSAGKRDTLFYPYSMGDTIRPGDTIDW